MPIALLEEEECDRWINAWLGRLGCREHYTTLTAAHDVARRSSELSNGAALIGTLLQHFAGRWANRVRKEAPGEKNWVWRQETKVDEENTKEKLLERRIVQHLGEEWGNAIPTASGVYHNGYRQCNIDLGFRDGTHLTFIELKWESNNQLYAALEQLAYACQWFLARQYSKEMNYGSDASLRSALAATRVDWVVLAPEKFYRTHNFAGLERALNDGIRDTAQVRTPGIPMSFRFEQFAAADGWESDPEILRNMVEGTQPVYQASATQVSASA